MNRQALPPGTHGLLRDMGINPIVYPLKLGHDLSKEPVDPTCPPPEPSERGAVVDASAQGWGDILRPRQHSDSVCKQQGDGAALDTHSISWGKSPLGPETSPKQRR